jgi:hypothetical protein
MQTIDTVWQRIVACEGETFHQVRGNPFTYRVAGQAIVPNRTPRLIPKSHFEKALALMPFRSTSDLQHLQGPSYLYAILTDARIIAGGATPRIKARLLGNAPVPSQRAPAGTATPALRRDGGSMDVFGHRFYPVGPLVPERENGQVRQLMPQAAFAGAKATRLNRYGAGPFCRFRIPANLPLRGVYALVVDQQVKYVGKCEHLSKRFNMGYGQISPRNCFEGGQNTNCKINRLVLKVVEAGGEVRLWFHETDAEDRIEARLIAQHRPPWNGSVEVKTVEGKSVEVKSVEV